jgi:tRNA nucleotidyltransferase (CCA-adding enzyme)
LTGLEVVLERARRRVAPSAADEKLLNGVATKVLEKVSAASRQYKEVTDVLLGGSFAKQTWLPSEGKETADVDVFVKLAADVDARRFERVGLTIGREASRGYRHGKKYAQHPYTEATVDGVKVNIVPCYDVKPGEWKSAADRSPYHVLFVKENLDQEKRTEVRLLKRFMKVIGVYGAEIENEGFSGYAAEVLVHRRGSFEGVLRYFAGIKPEGETMLSLTDPVDDGRELAKAISKESVARMVLASRRFLEKPDVSYFTRVRRRIRSGLAASLYVIRFDHKRLSEDTLWGELKKSTRQIVRYAEEQGFTIVRALAASDDAERSAILLLPGTAQVPRLEERAGPGVERAAEVARFVSKNRERAELLWAGDDGRVHLLQKRRVTRLGDLLEEVRRSDIDGIGASREVAQAIKKNGRILSGKAVAREASREPWLRAGVEELIADSIGTD